MIIITKNIIYKFKVNQLISFIKLKVIIIIMLFYHLYILNLCPLGEN